MANIRWGPPGLHHVGAYQVSGTPYITGSDDMPPDGETGSEVRIQFPYVTQNIMVINHITGSNRTLRVHFASKDTDRTIHGLHFVELDSDEDTISMNVKCTELYVSAGSGTGVRGFRVIASLTNIPSGTLGEYSGVGITE